MLRVLFRWSYHMDYFRWSLGRCYIVIPVLVLVPVLAFLSGRYTPCWIDDAAGTALYAVDIHHDDARGSSGLGKEKRKRPISRKRLNQTQIYTIMTNHKIHPFENIPNPP